jgi:hypothetical protein
VYWHFSGNCCLHHQGGGLVHISKTAWHNVPKDSSPHSIKHILHMILVSISKTVLITNYKQKSSSSPFVEGTKWDSTYNILYNEVIDWMIQDSNHGRG